MERGIWIDHQEKYMEVNQNWRNGVRKAKHQIGEGKMPSIFKIKGSNEISTALINSENGKTSVGNKKRGITLILAQPSLNREYFTGQLERAGCIGRKESFATWFNPGSCTLHYFYL